MTSLSEKIVRIEFPGATTRFNKSLLKELIEDIERNLPGVKVEWLRCKPPWSIYQFPSDCVHSSFEDANAVVIKKHGKKILESFKYRSGGGSIIVYEGNLTEGELNIISKILIDKGFESPEMRKASLEKFNKSLFYQMICAIIMLTVCINSGFFLSHPSIFLFFIIIALILQIPIWYYWRKGYRIKHGKESPS